MKVIDKKWKKLCREVGADPACGCMIVRYEGIRLHVTKANATVTLTTIREADSVAVGAPLDFPGLIDIERVGDHITLVFEPVPGYRERVCVFSTACFDVNGPRSCRVKKAAPVSEDDKVD